MLNQVPHWYVDGTFDTAPRLFKLLFTFNIIMKGKNLPMLYCLLQNKQQKTYVEMFHNAIHNALRKVAKKKFNLVLSIQGCYFHLVSN
jgi:hypothetical protein